MVLQVIDVDYSAVSHSSDRLPGTTGGTRFCFAGAQQLWWFVKVLVRTEHAGLPAQEALEVR
jgi:hypothetical protein